ncbi:Photosystem I assembly protein Ycf3 [Emticicia aquatica]|jgi:tetratricopeptide (TPR) repeat protein|uniref:Photosystem I assembly protein Ycf3 n=1 Tax=Emticicia aquatica TaxID=1681835 RepID=A0ABN8EQE0_9BACT|nr:tetratricopeptide repeat protein [Emticicia aquatica]CAH0995113.1 Photosystem I assembly protein Ycf3 [Emticicia aquatica]
MSNKNNIFFLLLVSILLYACGQGNRERSKIPPTPFQAENIQNIASLEALTDAIRSNPSVAENYFKRAIILHKMGDSKKALEDINRADRLKQNTGKYLFVKALILRDLKQFREAFAFAQSAEILNVETPELYTLLGDLSQQRNDLAIAEQYLAKSLQIAPFDGETYFYQGTLAARKGDTSTAILKMNKAIEMKPSFKLGYSKLTEILKNKRLYDSALAVNKSAILQFPRNPEFYIDRGLVFSKFGRLDSALVYYDKATSIEPGRTDAMLYSATIYFRWKNYNKALEYYEKVLEANPEIPNINYSIALTLEQLGLLTKAEEFLKAEVERDPNNTQAIIALNRVSGQINSALGVYTAPIPVPTKKKVEPAVKPVVEEPRKLLDTARIKVNIIAPKKKVNIKTDSSRRLRF